MEKTTAVQIVMPQHCNGYKKPRLFGGQIMAWIDVVGAVAARRYTQRAVTTVCIDNLTFLKPAYLNDTVLNAEFTEAERKALVEQESGSSLNPKYGTALKDKTKDIITILSVEEMQSYIDGDILKTPGVDMWMRTPGRDLESAVYMTAKGNLVLYGDDVTDANLSVCPVIVLDYSKLENYVPETSN